MSPRKELGLQADLLCRQIRCVYGTRDAGMIWEETYRQALIDMGFGAGRANPCCFQHPARGIAIVVHNFTALGKCGDLDWYEHSLSKVFELKIRGCIGENTPCKAMRI